MALPSASLGHNTPTFLLVVTCGHRWVYALKNCSTPKQKWNVNLKGEGCPGLAPRPRYQASHGTTVEMHGTPAASQASETGLTVSGVEVASMRSNSWLWRRSRVHGAPTEGVDCESRETISTL